MPALAERSGQCLPAALLLGAMAMAGCQVSDRLVDGLRFAVRAGPHDQTSNRAATEHPGIGAAGTGQDGASSGHEVGHQDFPPVLGREAWVLRVSASRAPDDESLPRWRHVGLEDLLARPADRRPDFCRWLDQRNPVVAGNAAICLARLRQGQPAARLADTVRQPEIRMATRLAAAEALGQLPASVSVPLLRELVAQYGGRARQTGSSHLPQLHAELIRSVGRLLPGDSEPLLIEALRSPAASVRAAALRAWPSAGTAPLPPAVTDACRDSDARVRAAAVRLLAGRQANDAHDVVERALLDEDLTVRLAAVASLARLDDDASRQTARHLLADSNEMIRAAAVDALADMGAHADVCAAADDESWRVRRTVAAGLHHHANRQGSAVACRLAGDPHSDVARALVVALSHWPVEQAGPALLAAMAAKSYTVRQSAADQLARQWPPAGEFPVDAPPARRAEVLAALGSRWAAEMGSRPPDAKTAVADRSTGPAAPYPSQQVDMDRQVSSEVRRRVSANLRLLSDRQTPVEDHRAVERALVALGPPLVGVLERFVRESKRPLPMSVYRRVLPGVDATFELLARLDSPDLDQRRRAAKSLAAHTRRTPLGDLALMRLETLIIPETDSNIWWNVEIALADDRRPEATRIHLAALSHPAPEVRRRACQYLARRGDPQHVAALMATLDDPSPIVLRAAVDALGETRRLDDPAPLRQLLRSRDASLRFAAAQALAKLGYESGAAALERLAYHGDPSIRRQVAEVMGQLGSTAFTPTLIRLLDDRLTVRKSALASLQQIVPQDAAARKDDAALSLDEQVDRWRRWYAGSHR